MGSRSAGCINWQKSKFLQWSWRMGHNRDVQPKALSVKPKHYTDDLHEKFDEDSDEHCINCLEWARTTATENISLFRQVKINSGKLLVTNSDTWAMPRAPWEDLNDRLRSSVWRCGPVPAVTCKEAAAAIMRMKNVKVAGADDISSEFWKSCGLRVLYGSLAW